MKNSNLNLYTYIIKYLVGMLHFHISITIPTYFAIIMQMKSKLNNKKKYLNIPTFSKRGRILIPILPWFTLV